MKLLSALLSVLSPPKGKPLKTPITHFKLSNNKKHVPETAPTQAPSLEALIAFKQRILNDALAKTDSLQKALTTRQIKRDRLNDEWEDLNNYCDELSAFLRKNASSSSIPTQKAKKDVQTVQSPLITQSDDSWEEPKPTTVAGMAAKVKELDSLVAFHQGRHTVILKEINDIEKCNRQISEDINTLKAKVKTLLETLQKRLGGRTTAPSLTHYETNNTSPQGSPTKKLTLGPASRQ